MSRANDLALSDNELLAMVAAFAVKAHSANGYQKLPSGLIVQWGITAGAAQNVPTTVTLPIAFPTACRSVQLTYVDGATAQPATRGAPVQVGSFGASSFQYSHAGSASGAQHLWTAIGY